MCVVAVAFKVSPIHFLQRAWRGPVAPHNHVLDKLNPNQQENFRNALKGLIKNSYEALSKAQSGALRNGKLLWV